MLAFKQGTRIAVAFVKTPRPSWVRQAVADAGFPNAQSQQTPNVAGSGLEGFQIQTPVLTPAQQSELKAALDGAAADNATRVVVIAANGPVFSSGHDLKELTRHRADGD